MKFKAAGKEPQMIALLTGHTMVVSPTGTDVPQRFRRAAIAAGCTPVGMGLEDPLSPASTADTRQDLIRGAIEKMLDGDSESDFNADGKPDLKRLGEVAGFKVSRDERDAIWDVVKAELKPDGD